MKNLIFTIFICSILSAGMFDNVTNPNGKPGLATIGYNTYNASFEAKLPITKFITIGFNQVPVYDPSMSLEEGYSVSGYLLDTRNVTLADIDFRGYDMNEVCDGDYSWDCAYGFDSYNGNTVDISIPSYHATYVQIPTYSLNTSSSTSLINNYKIEIHIPLWGNK